MKHVAIRANVQNAMRFLHVNGSEKWGVCLERHSGVFRPIGPTASPRPRPPAVSGATPRRPGTPVQRRMAVGRRDRGVGGGDDFPPLV